MQPQYLKLNELLQTRIFCVPEYQRPYSWETAQRSDLFADIEKLINKNDASQHFMATIVGLNPKKTIPIGVHEFSQIDLVDGQQRITTLVILLKEIGKLLVNSSDAAVQVIGSDLSRLLVKEDNHTILLQTNHDSAGVLMNYLLGAPNWSSPVTTLAERNLEKASRESKNIALKWQKDGRLIEALRVVQNRLGFLYYELDNEGIVYSTFEVLNSRGRPVEWLDKTKSMLMGIIYENFPDAHTQKFSECHRIWTELYDVMGIKDISGDEVLRFSATLRAEVQPSRTLSAQMAYERFRQMAIEDPKNITRLMEVLLDTAKKLKLLYGDATRHTLTTISQARLLYLAISSSQILKKNDRQRLLELWEKVTFLIYGISRKDSRTAVGGFVRLAHSIYNESQGSVTDWISDLKALASGFDIRAEVDALLKGRDCYTDWSNELRYFLFRYEARIAEQKKIQLSQQAWSDIWASQATETIEHICPQSSNSDWAGALGKERNVWVNNVHRLGNLALLPRGLNSQAGNAAFSEKKKVYKRASMLHLDEIVSNTEWNRKSIDQREKLLRQFALKEWAL